MSFSSDPNGLGGMLGGLQQQMESMKAEAASAQVTGQAGGGLVQVVANGGMEILSVRIADDALVDREILEDMVTAAVNDALRQAQAVMGQQVAQMMGGLPPGMF
ncbi:MAG: YbaB/EbfC family nucleoid-associated protein [Myxococcota bacterium]|nr:YbaB/EbfC family nucleoid-associated protein [Myxococcota bacterium]